MNTKDRIMIKGFLDKEKIQNLQLHGTSRILLGVGEIANNELFGLKFITQNRLPS